MLSRDDRRILTNSAYQFVSDHYPMQNTILQTLVIREMVAVMGGERGIPRNQQALAAAAMDAMPVLREQLASNGGEYADRAIEKVTKDLENRRDGDSLLLWLTHAYIVARVNAYAANKDKWDNFKIEDWI